MARMTNMNGIAAAITPITLLADYGITAILLGDQLTAVTSFQGALEVKREKIVERTNATSNISQEFKANKKLVKQLDGIVNTMIATQDDFVKGYFKSRIIINTGKGHKTSQLVFKVNSNIAETIFEGKFEAGDSFIVRNHSGEPLLVGLTATEGHAPEFTPIKMEPYAENVILIPKDANVLLCNYISIQAQNTHEDAHVTVILSKGVSKSKASNIELTGTPK